MPNSNNNSSGSNAALSALSSLSPVLASAVGYFGQTQTNKTNMQINRENMMYDAYKTINQNKFQKQMYDYTFAKENEYNDPSAQMQRYRNAGLNPYLMMQGQNALGASSTSMSSASGGAPSSIPMQNPASSFAALSSLSGLALNAAQIRKLNADANAVDVDTDIKEEQRGTQLDLLLQTLNNAKVDEKTKNAILRSALVQADIDETVQAYKEGLVREEYEAASIANEINRRNLKYLDKEKLLGLAAISMTIKKMRSEIAVNNVTVDQIKAYTNQLKQLAISLKLDNRLKMFSPTQLAEILASRVMGEKADAYNKYIQSRKGNPQNVFSELVTDIAYFMSGELSDDEEDGVMPTRNQINKPPKD